MNRKSSNNKQLVTKIKIKANLADKINRGLTRYSQTKQTAAAWIVLGLLCITGGIIIIIIGPFAPPLIGFILGGGLCGIGGIMSLLFSIRFYFLNTMQLIVNSKSHNAPGLLDQKKPLTSINKNYTDKTKQYKKQLKQALINLLPKKTDKIKDIFKKLSIYRYKDNNGFIPSVEIICSNKKRATSLNKIFNTDVKKAINSNLKYFEEHEKVCRPRERKENDSSQYYLSMDIEDLMFIINFKPNKLSKNSQTLLQDNNNNNNNNDTNSLDAKLDIEELKNNLLNRLDNKNISKNDFDIQKSGLNIKITFNNDLAKNQLPNLFTSFQMIKKDDNYIIVSQKDFFNVASSPKKMEL